MTFGELKKLLDGRPDDTEILVTQPSRGPGWGGPALHEALPGGLYLTQPMVLILSAGQIKIPSAHKPVWPELSNPVSTATPDASIDTRGADRPEVVGGVPVNSQAAKPEDDHFKLP